MVVVTIHVSQAPPVVMGAASIPNVSSSIVGNAERPALSGSFVREVVVLVV